MAETLYEQVYCELLAGDQRSRLPDFGDFRKNNESVQALLLKPFARREGIELPPPRRAAVASVERRAPQPLRAVAAGSERSLAGASLQSTPAARCAMEPRQIQCGSQRFVLVGNRANGELGEGVFAADNRMNLPVFKGEAGDRDAVSRYLLDAYQQYLVKMLAIGLGGATMSIDKFAYIFDDLRARGVDFPSRFETMYHYLKQDKLRNAVSGKIQAPQSISAERCYEFPEAFVCAVGQRNFVYQTGG